jgi:hypothetical protein
LFSIITKCIRSFSDSKVRKQIGFSQKITLAGKEGQPSTDISMLEGRRRRRERRRRPKRRRRRRPERRQWWWPGGPMRVKALRMFGLGGSSPLMVVKCLSLLLLAIIYFLLNDLL